MYIICSIVTNSIGLLGLFILPGTPYMPNRTFLSRTEIELAAERLKRAGHSIPEKFRFRWTIVKQLA